MATMHGTWTLGAVAGGAVIAAGLRTDVDVQVLMVGCAVALAAAALAAGNPAVEPQPARPQLGGPQVAAVLRPKLVIALGGIGSAAFFTEGVATDWSGVHATRVLGADLAAASLMVTVFFAAMTVVRFVGDAVRARLGAAITIRLAGGTATAGYGLVLLAGALPSPNRPAIGCAIAGWALVGAGMAVVWPLMISQLGAANVAARRLATITTISYSGGLIGPALVGLVATEATLPAALLIPAALALALAAAAPAALAAVVRNQITAPSREHPTSQPAATNGELR
jgi:hypothetical protein